MTRRNPADTEQTALEILVTKKDDWIEHRDNYDVAVYHITDKWFTAKNISALATGTAEPFWMAGVHNFGPGHDLYLATRFQGLDSPDWNLPILQTGVISSLPLSAGIPKQFEEPCFLIETHSRLGYSGAPVFAYLPPGPVVAPAIQTALPRLPLLGIFSQHITTYEPVVDKPSRDGKNVPCRFVSTPAALGAVVPAWEILEILEGDEAVAKRKEVEAKWAEDTMDEPLPMKVEPAYSEPEMPSSITVTEDLLHKLAQVPLEEAEEVHRGHQS
jgi:hypothetical protein